MPRLVRMYIRHVAIGFLLAAIFTALLIGFNVGNLRHLVTHTAEGPLAAVLLFVLNGIVFAGVQFGIAIMRMAAGSDGDRGRRAPARPVAQPVAVHRKG